MKLNKAIKGDDSQHPSQLIAKKLRGNLAALQYLIGDRNVVKQELRALLQELLLEAIIVNDKTIFQFCYNKLYPANTPPTAANSSFLADHVVTLYVRMSQWQSNHLANISALFATIKDPKSVTAENLRDWISERIKAELSRTEALMIKGLFEKLQGLLKNNANANKVEMVKVFLPSF